MITKNMNLWCHFQVTDCIEAPASKHKKANNVFILVSEEKGMFENGKCYLSAETLTEMRAWIQDMRTVIFKETPTKHHRYIKNQPHKALIQMNDSYNPDCHLTYSYSEDEEDEMYCPELSQRSFPRSPSSSRSVLLPMPSPSKSSCSAPSRGSWSR